MKLYLMTDLEGVAGVLDFEEWTGPGNLHYQTARELLTHEVNAAFHPVIAEIETTASVTKTPSRRQPRRSVPPAWIRADFFARWARASRRSAGRA